MYSCKTSVCLEDLTTEFLVENSSRKRFSSDERVRIDKLVIQPQDRESRSLDERIRSMHFQEES